MQETQRVPGLELDAEVAKKVMGLPVVWSTPPYVTRNEFFTGFPQGRRPYLKGKVNGCMYDWASCPSYSTNIQDAFKVVEHMRALGYEFALISDIGREGPPTYAAEFDQRDGNIGETTYLHGARHANPATAICLAALSALKEA